MRSLSYLEQRVFALAGDGRSLVLLSAAGPDGRRRAMLGDNPGGVVPDNAIVVATYDGLVPESDWAACMLDALDTGKLHHEDLDAFQHRLLRKAKKRNWRSRNGHKLASEIAVH